MAHEQSANPFRPGNGVLPAYLAGRERPLAEFDAFIADSHPLHANWTVTGLRGTGKTVLLGAISRAIPEEERIIVIEDTSELRLIQAHCLYLEAQHADHVGRGALSVRTAVLLRKLGRQQVHLEPDYCGFEIPDRFVVGYGLDFNDDYRHLPHVAVLDEGPPPPGPRPCHLP